MESSSVTRAVELADFMVQTAQQRPAELLNPASVNTKWKSIHQKLIELYVEESKRESEIPGLTTTSHLLDKLVKRDKLNCLVVNLYPGNEGYSLMLRGKNGSDSETIKLPYEESELLEYIDAEELPPVLVDLLDKSQVNVYHSGCVIAELRDHRRTTNNSFDTRYILLRPTPQTLLCDINALTNDGHRWTQEDKFNLESQLLLATQEPLCLDPSVSVAIIANKFQHEKGKLNTHQLKRAVKKYSQTSVNRKRKMAQCPAPKHLRLYDFVHKKRDKIKSSPPVNLKVGKTCVDMWRQRNLQLVPPKEIDVHKYAKAYDKPKLTLDNTPIIVEEYVMEMERTQSRIYFARLVILQRMSDDFYLGELHVDRDYTEGKKNTSNCRFALGTKANVTKYIHQFREIFTEEGRKAVKITHYIPGREPRVTFTHSSSSQTPTQNNVTSTQAFMNQATSVAANITQSDLQSSHTSNETNGGPPIKLSLQLNAPGSLTSAGLMSPSGAVSSPVPVGSVAIQPSGHISVNLQQQPAAPQQIQLQSPPARMNAEHRMKRSKSYSSRSANSSPVSTPTGSQPPLPSYSQATSLSSSRHRHSSRNQTDTPPPPPGRSQTPSSNSSRRSSLNDSHGSLGSSLGQSQGALVSQAMQQGANIANFIQATAGQLQSSGSTSGSAPPTPTGTPTPDSSAQQTSSNLPANINITNIAGLPQNINIQNLAGLQSMGLANIQGLQNMQVSLTGVSMPGGGIAVPVPISMINTTNPSSLISTPAGIFVSSLAGVQNVAANGSAAGNTTTITSGASQTALVTMATSTTTSSVASGNTPIMVSTAGLTTSAQIIGSQTGMLQVPLSMATQLMAGLKGAPQGIRAQGTPLSLLQIPGQQSLQLLGANIQGQRAQLQPIQQSGGRPITSAPATGSNASPAAQNAASLSQLAPGSRASGQPLGNPQVMQLTPQQQQQIHIQQIHALQKQQLLQQQQQMKSGQGQLQKSKSKKRTTPTPPK